LSEVILLRQHTIVKEEIVTKSKAKASTKKTAAKKKAPAKKEPPIPEKAMVPFEEAPRVHTKETITKQGIIEAFRIMGIAKNLNDEQMELFVAVAHEWQLNPLKREIHAVKIGKDSDDDSKGGTLVPVVGYEVYIDRAEATGRLEYWVLEESGEIMADAKEWKKSAYTVAIHIKRRDWPREFVWKVRYLETVMLKWVNGTPYPNSVWQKRGHFMTQKCAIGQAFRLCFRDVLRGMPFVDAEIESEDDVIDVTPNVKEPQAVGGVKTDTEGKLLEEKPATAQEIEAAKANLNSTYIRLARVYTAQGPLLDAAGKSLKLIPEGRADCFYLTTEDELVAMTKEGKDAGDNVTRLRDLAVQWNQMLTNRMADHGLKEGVK
jgi:phage recombination protein Bet